MQGNPSSPQKYWYSEKQFRKFSNNVFRQQKCFGSYLVNDMQTKNRRKKSFIRKMSVRSIPIYPANLATFEESWIFGRPKQHLLDARGTQTRLMWYQILRSSFCLAHCASFMSRWSLLRGGGLHIRRWDRAVFLLDILFIIQTSLFSDS